MPLPEIDLNSIRVHRGSQATAFEELCCQLANDELISGRVGCDRKGAGGDGGVECYATLKNGSEVGWQVKFYSNFDSMIGSLEKSLQKALAKHPNMNRFIVCFPFDLADSRREDVRTSLSKWNAWRDLKISEQKRLGRDIEIERWDAHAIKLRLTDSNARSAGRVAYWFDREMLNADWFKAAFSRSEIALGKRYSPETHIDLPVRQSILASVRDPSIFDLLARHSAQIRDRISGVASRENPEALKSATTAAAELERTASSRPEPFPLDGIAGSVQEALDAVVTWYRSREESQTAERDLVDDESRAIWKLAGALRRARGALEAPMFRHLDSRSLLCWGKRGRANPTCSPTRAPISSRRTARHS